MPDTYKNTGEKIRLRNRNACIYTKGNRKTKYIKSNKEMVLLSKELKRLKINKKQIGGNSEIFNRYTNLEKYEPFDYSASINVDNATKYMNNIKIVENPEDNPKRDVTSMSNYFLSDADAQVFLENNPIDDLVFSQTKINVVKWTIPDDSKVLIIGDIHGDKIALEKVFGRWFKKGYLKPYFILAPNIYIISTGDLIDYGSNSINVLCSMLFLRKNNPKQVMLLCGNHESKDNNIPGRDKFKSEVNKFKNEFNKDNNKIITAIIDNISLIGPDMLALHFGDEIEGTYFMHGMYPVKFENQQNFFGFQKPTENKITYWPAEKVLPEILEKLIQWNDLSIDSSETSASSRNVEPTCNVGSTILTEIMNKYRIKGFIRGHQDYCGAQLYPLKDPEECTQTANIITTKVANNVYTRVCKNKSASLFSSGWCKTDGIKYQWENINNGESINENRIITISMANEKTGSAPLGGYIELTVTPIV